MTVVTFKQRIYNGPVIRSCFEMTIGIVLLLYYSKLDYPMKTRLCTHLLYKNMGNFVPLHPLSPRVQSLVFPVDLDLGKNRIISESCRDYITLSKKKKDKNEGQIN